MNNEKVGKFAFFKNVYLMILKGILLKRMKLVVLLGIFAWGFVGHPVMT